MISAESSNSGKTVITTGLLQAYETTGYSVGAVKCGPDYIDPMFHRSVQGIKSYNIDPFLMGEEASKRVLSYFSDTDIVIFEGAMGYYDGVAGTVRASAYEIAKLTDTPVIIIMDPGKQGNTIAAKLFGLQRFAPDSNIAGVILNRCSKAKYEYYKAIIERENGLTVFGYLEEQPDAVIESRHLGLKDPEEIEGYREKLEKTVLEISKTVDLKGLLDVAQETDPGVNIKSPIKTAAVTGSDTENRSLCRIAAARDEAFSFYYPNSLEKLASLGAEITYFSPIHDKALPEGTDALYLGGGYPELHMDELARNETMRTLIKASVTEGMPTVAECGGFLYLQDSLSDREGGIYSGCGVFPGKAVPCDRPVRFGYCMMKAETNSMLFNKGEEIPAHEFHYWDTDANGEGMTISKPGREKTYRECFVNENLYAGFPHICFDTELPLAERFVEAAARYRSVRTGGVK